MRRIVRRRDDDPVGQPRFPPAIVSQNRMRNHRGRRVFVPFGDHHLDSVCRQHFERGGAGRDGQCVRVDAEKQRAGDVLPRAIQANRLGDREDVPLVERLLERRTAMSGGAKRHALRRHCGVGHPGVVGGDEPRHIDQHSRLRRLSGQGAYFHGSLLCCSVFELRHFCQTAAMAFGTAEVRGEKGLHQLPRERVTDDEAAQADQVEVVVLDALMRGKRFIDQAGANPRPPCWRRPKLPLRCRKWRCRGALLPRRRHGPAGRQNPEVIVRLRCAVPEILHLMTGLTQRPEQILLQFKTTVIRRDPDAMRHSL